MNYDYVESPLYKSIMAGLATGITVTCINLIYNFIYRGITGFSPAVSVINVATIIFACTLVCTIAGILFYFIVTYWKKSKKIFIGFFVIITVVAIVLGVFSKKMSLQFEGLYFGMIIITGICAAFLIPWFREHKNVFIN